MMISDCGDIKCEWCGWCNPSQDELEDGVWDGDKWFCETCVAEGYDHVFTDDEWDEIEFADHFPKLYAELVALRAAAAARVPPTAT